MKRLVLIVASAFMFFSCTENGIQKKVRIGVFEPMTGVNSAGGLLELEGVRLANTLYPKVSVGDKTYGVELVIVDNKSDKSEAINAAKRLTEKENVSVILGSYGSSLSIAAGQTILEGRVPAIGLSCTNPLVTQGNPYYFRVAFIDPFQGMAMARYAVNNLKAKKAVLLREVSNDYSVGLVKFFADEFRKLSHDDQAISAIFGYYTGDEDFSQQISEIKVRNPDVIFAPGNYTESALIMKQARAAGITAPFLGGDTWETSQFIEVGKDAVEGCVFSTFFAPEGVSSDLQKTFLKEYDVQYHKEPSADAALGFDAYRLALNAIERAASLDTEKIRDALAATVDFKGVAGNITLDENGDATKSAFIKTVKDGKFTYLTTVNP